VKVARGPVAWTRRALLAAVLVGAAVIPGRAMSGQAQHCSGPSCDTPGSIRWQQPLTGSWVAESGVSGTVTAQNSPYAASDASLAVVGSGTSVTAYQMSDGKRLWQAALTGFAAGTAIVGVRVFPGVVAVGVQPPAGRPARRDEVLLSAATGQRIRAYRAATYGGAIEASKADAVIVGTSAVTAYANATGRVLWRRPTGPGAQSWRVSGQYVYVTEAASGNIGATGVPAVRRIDLRTGAERVLRPSTSTFPGTISDAVDGDLLFSGAGGVSAYNGQTGKLIWHRDSAVLELADESAGLVYLGSGSSLIGVDVGSGVVVSQAGMSVANSLYWVSDGTALGLDQDALGQAWGYDLTTRRVVWTTSGLPWPHFFVDLSGLGGSASQRGDTALIATCAQVGTSVVAGSAPPCTKPELAAVQL
jgi:outer membrane protein assembly factor BamB